MSSYEFCKWLKLDNADKSWPHLYFLLAGTLLAAKLALERGIACSTGGGTHHAFPDHGSGYCLVNDLAVTAMSLVQTGSVHRVVVVDLDVHQAWLS